MEVLERYDQPIFRTGFADMELSTSICLYTAHRLGDLRRTPLNFIKGWLLR